ncbi:MAG: hypothetical protein JWP02_1112 [Acidimicrobiales bacterium]|nr:hypothetical protein [Acidimicrobiales bacterium]
MPVGLTFPLIARLRRGVFALDIQPFPRSGIVPGDHLTNFYRFWLFSDDLGHGAVRLRDPYAFRLVAKAVDPPLGWVFGPVFAVLDRIVGAIGAYNLVAMLAVGLSVAFGYLWLRSLGAPPPAALVGAVALAVFPANYARLTVHIKAFFFWMMPLALYLLERGRQASNRRVSYAWAAAAGVTTAALVTVIEPETGVYFWPLLLLYAVGRSRRPVWLGLGTGLVLTAAYVAWFYAAVIGPSITSKGRTLGAVFSYAPGVGDIVTRTYTPLELEHYVWPGVGIVAAVYGAYRLFRAAVPLGVKLLLAAAPLVVVVALGPRAPGVGHLYSFLFEHVAAFRVVQTPGRAIFVLAPIVGLGVAFGLPWLAERRWSWAVCALLAAALVIDARAVTWRQSRPIDSRLVAATKGARGIVDLPITNGMDYLATPYEYWITLVPAPRAQGATPFVTGAERAGNARLATLDSGTVQRPAVDYACSRGATHVVVWEDLFGRGSLPTGGAAVVASLKASPSFELLAARDGIDVFRIRC